MASLSAASSGVMATCWLMRASKIRLSRGCVEDGPRFQEGLDPVGAVFAANPRVFEAAPGCLGIVRHAIDHDPAGPHLRGHPFRTREVSAKDGAVKTVFGVVGNSDRIFVGIIRNRGEHGAKN